MTKIFSENKKKPAIIWNDKPFTYEWLLDRYFFWKNKILSKNIVPGTVTIVEADFSPNSVALLLALIESECIFVPITKSIGLKRDSFIEIAQGQVLFNIDQNDNVKISKLAYEANHPIYQKLRSNKEPGLVLFSSGSTGKSKASVHNINGILDKFRIRRHSFRSITFLLYDHIGGFNTLFYLLSNAGLIVTLRNRNPDDVLKYVEKYQVELLPTSPTFINLILLSEAYKRHNIKSLKMITYGTEPMPEHTLKRFNHLFPNIQMLQTYGLSEVGILRSKSKSSDSLWVKVGGEGFQTRIVDNMLQIKAKSAMLGYLNEINPFTEDGWFKTNDIVESDGDYIKILGRESEIINVGGEKVFPQEIENIILRFENIAEVTVYAEKNPIIGNIVCAKIKTNTNVSEKEFINELKNYCRNNLKKHEVPIKIQLVKSSLHGDRFKKIRENG